MSTKMRERVEVGRNGSNLPIYKWACGNSKKELHKSIANLHVRYGLLPNMPIQQAQPQASGVTFEKYTPKWLEIYKAPKVKPTTLRGYRSMLSTHLFPAFGKQEIDRITTEDIQVFLNERKHLAKKTLKELLTFLNEIFCDAIEDGHLKKNPTKSRKLVVPSSKETVREALLEEQVVSIIKQIATLDG